MKAPVGAIVAISYDAAPDTAVAIGDVLRTATGRTYIVVAARQQARGKHAGRWHLRCAVQAAGGTASETSPREPRQPSPLRALVHELRFYVRSL